MQAFANLAWVAAPAEMLPAFKPGTDLLEAGFRDTRPFKYWRPAQTMWERVHPRTPA
ncbi:protein of unknown function [Pseudomonas sp. JV551A1]|nr:protein of unknown function [Pseudomonas sp. JV551A1]